MDWMSCQNIFNSITKDSQKKQIRFKSPSTNSVGEFFRNIKTVPEERRAGFWVAQGGIILKWAQEELFMMGFADQRFKYKKNGASLEVEYIIQDLTSGTPIETVGQDTVEATLQALYIAIKDKE